LIFEQRVEGPVSLVRRPCHFSLALVARPPLLAEAFSEEFGRLPSPQQLFALATN